MANCRGPELGLTAGSPGGFRVASGVSVRVPASACANCLVSAAEFSGMSGVVAGVSAATGAEELPAAVVTGVVFVALVVIGGALSAAGDTESVWLTESLESADLVSSTDEAAAGDAAGGCAMSAAATTEGSFSGAMELLLGLATSGLVDGTLSAAAT